MPKRKEIFIETHRRERITITHRRPTPVADKYCGVCGRNVEWLTVAEAAALSGVDSEMIRQAAEQGRFDSRMAQPNILLLCLGSLFREP